MPGETDLHKTLKKEACRWLFGAGYRCIAAEVRLKPLGIIDAVGTGILTPSANNLQFARTTHQVCFIECKASRADFMRDHSNNGQMELCLLERRSNLKVKRARRRAENFGLRQALGLGKFQACLLQPMANLHYILAPAGMLQKKDIPPRWGLLSYGAAGVSVILRPDWQECAHTAHVESAIARTLTCDIYRADDRAMSSVNRAIFAQQQALAEKIRAARQQIVFAPDIAVPPATNPSA